MAGGGSRTDWFHDAKWGVFMHFLAAPASSSGGAETDSGAWNRWVDSFDVKGLAAQLADIRARYFFITIGQNSGHYCAPNEEYDRLTGIRPSKCSRRDLVAELYDALAPHGIRLMVYLPAGAPEFDPAAVKALSWTRGGRCAEFQRNWEAVIRCWSLRWGRKIHGWWFDGCYFNSEMYYHDDEPNFRSFAAAVRAGNPDSLIAWNPGVEYPPRTVHDEEDYTAGEINELQFVDSPGRWDRHAQFQILTHLGAFWGQPPIRFTAQEAVEWTLGITDCGGVFTWDAPPTREGLLHPAALEVLKQVGRAVDATRGRPDLAPPKLVRTTVAFTRTPVAGAGGGTPGSIRVSLKNIWQERISGEVILGTEPANFAAIGDGGRLSYDLAPGATKEADMQISLLSETLGDSDAYIVVGRSGTARQIRIKIPSRERMTLPRVKEIRRVEDVEETLSDIPGKLIINRQGRTLADIKLAVSGGNLAIFCRVADQIVRQSAKFWDASCVEVFGTGSEGGKIGQIFLAPATESEPARAMRLASDENMSKSEIVPAPEISFASWSVPGGYRSAALIPLAWWLGLDNAPDRFLLEIAVSTGLDASSFSREAMFRNFDASQRSEGYAIVSCG